MTNTQRFANWAFHRFAVVWLMLSCCDMIAITGKVHKHGHEEVGHAMVPANHTEAQGVGTWGLVIAGSLLLITATFIVLLLLAA